MTAYAAPRTLVFGRLRRDFVILPDGRRLFDVPGGSLLYTAVGIQVWEPYPPAGLLARVGENFPADWLDDFERRGLNCRGINVLPQAIDSRSFWVHQDPLTRSAEDPLVYFGAQGEQLPPELFGYRRSKKGPDSRTQMDLLSPRFADLPADFLDATAAHLCPLDYLSAVLLPGLLRQRGFTVLTVDPSAGCMTPMFWDDLPAMLAGLTAFMPSEEKVRSLFQGRSNDLWEIAAGLASHGCDIVVIKRGSRGQLVYDAATKSRWEIPAYPSRFANPDGAGDAFCGAFISGYLKTFDPLQAALHGNIASSMVVEGNGPFFALDAMPGLPDYRLNALRENVRRV